MLLRLLGQTGEKTAVAAVVAAVAVGVVSGDCGKWSSCVCLVYCRMEAEVCRREAVDETAELASPTFDPGEPELCAMPYHTLSLLLCTYIINVLVGKRPLVFGMEGGRRVCCNNKSRVVFQTHMTTTDQEDDEWEAKVCVCAGEDLIKLETHFLQPTRG